MDFLKERSFLNPDPVTGIFGLGLSEKTEILLFPKLHVKGPTLLLVVWEF